MQEKIRIGGNEMQQEEKSKKRTSIGKISGIVGIFCNCILAGSKIIIGNFAGSMSIAADRTEQFIGCGKFDRYADRI